MDGTGSYIPEAPHLQEQDLAGKVAVVTGATKGIGRAIALGLATRGAAVLGTYSDPSSAQHFDTLSHTVSALYSNAFPSFPSTSSTRISHTTHPTQPKLVGIAANILSPDCADLIARTLETEFDGHVDILVNNAAIVVRHKIGEMELGDVEKSLLGNVQTPVLMVETLVRKKLFRPNARIVNISSDRVREGRVGGSVFAATKTALESLTRSWALELGSAPGMQGTTVNAVSVGLTDSHGFRSLPDATQQALKDERLPKVTVAEGGRMGECEDVADVVGWLVSEKARWVSGSVVAANGGAARVG
ncbi:NAD(P)-binding protein [Cenococcum geophilum 1.58]|uniref:NAD(P)-binding protein n=1 Tax=Cenococcum geophilum 1.58 TaxID=794803 RepID=UPI00358FCF81|nr:NAD(P)-binding protein [Cenococcum geophilum 1.58]